ncbi:hypothetical protein GCM10023097_37060 [Streptomyces collinus]
MGQPGFGEDRAKFGDLPGVTGGEDQATHGHQYGRERAPAGARGTARATTTNPLPATERNPADEEARLS